MPDRIVLEMPGRSLRLYLWAARTRLRNRLGRKRRTALDVDEMCALIESMKAARRG